MNINRHAPGLALAAALLVAPLALAQRDADLIRQARQQRELATQKAEADLRTTLRAVKSMKPAEALATLKKSLAEVDAQEMLDESRKKQIVLQLQNQIKFIENEARARGEKLTPTAPAVKSAKEEARRAELRAQEEERQRVKEAVTQVNQLLGQQRNQEAERQAKALAQQYPENPAARVMGQSASLQVRIREAKDILARLEESHNVAMKDLSKSATLPGQDLEYDKERWKQIAKSKYRGAGDPLTEKEQAILKGLSRTMQPDFKGTKFDEAIDILQKAIGTPIVVDRKAMEDAMIGTDATVNFTLPREVSVRTVLRKVLQENGLGYVIRDEMVYVTTLAKVRDMMTTRTYTLADIVTGNPLTTAPWDMAAQEQMVVKAIIDSIKRSVDPMSWEGEGGKASIHYDPVTKALIVRQSAEVHMLLRKSMQ